MSALIFGLLLAITLTPLGWIQWRQFRLLDDVTIGRIRLAGHQIKLGVRIAIIRRNHDVPPAFRSHRILLEGPRLGRTEQFTEVSFDRDMPEGDIVTAQIIGWQCDRLTA